VFKGYVDNLDFLQLLNAKQIFRLSSETVKSKNWLINSQIAHIEKDASTENNQQKRTCMENKREQ
jgi:hypothetical protein